MNIKHKNFIISVFLTLSLVCNFPAVFAAAEEYNINRGEAADMLFSAADDYNPSVLKTDIIKGYEDGLLHEDWNVTRAEALVMLERAFGKLPEPAGHNARVALPKESFTDIPDWAQGELDNVFNSGIVAGTGNGLFSPDELVTDKQMKLFINRVYALFASNKKDDFYAAVNSDKLADFEIQPGNAIAGTLYDLNDESNTNVSKIIDEIVAGDYAKGSKEQKIADYYNSIVDIESRNTAGITPIKRYLDMIDSAKTVDDLIAVQSTVMNDLGSSLFMEFGITVDLKSSEKYMLYFSVKSASLPKEAYTSDDESKTEPYIDYIKTLFTLCGETESEAQKMANSVVDFERLLSENSLNTEEYGNVDKIYNVFTMQEIRDMFKNIDMDIVFKDSRLAESERICISDVGLTKAFADYFNNDNTESLKAYAKYALLVSWGGALNQEFADASDKFSEEYMGTSGAHTMEERAAAQIKLSMPDYIGEIYAERFFSDEAKQDVKKMVDDIIKVYRNRLENITWMSDSTKRKAIKKLDAMNVKIGYPDSWDTYLDDVEIKSKADGGSYFSNTVSITKSLRDELISLQNETVDKNEWAMYPYTVNACYNLTANDITFPAAILQAPFYDVDAPYEQNLGGIGYIIAHEITHAFDNNGAKFDENGNAVDWWEQRDYEEFQKLCLKMTEFYDGQEAVPGIAMNGTLTLSENVADQGAAACITEVAAGLDAPDFETLYESLANCWASTASREYYSYASNVDVHSADKLRVNRVLANLNEFYTTFDINERDGMYVAPEDRVKIW